MAHVHAKRKRSQRPEFEVVHDDLNNEAPDSSVGEVSEFEQELKAIRALAQSRAINFAADEAGSYKNITNFKDETMRLIEEIEITIESIQSSNFYSQFVEQLRSNATIRSNIRRILGDKLQMDMVIYGLGSIQYNYVSQYQLALALLLKRQFPHWIGAIEAYDPLFTPVDIETMEMLGCNVPTVDEVCKKQVERPTIFCLPYVTTVCVSNLLEANWCPARLNNMVLLGSSFNDLAAMFSEERNDAESANDLLEDRVEYIEAIVKYTIEIEVVIPEAYRRMFGWCTWHFFSLDADCDLNLLLPSDIPTRVANTNDFIVDIHYQGLNNLELPFKENQNSTPRDWARFNLTTRNTRAMHCFWQPPPIGWVKLNFSGRGRSGNAPAGFGGVLHDGRQNCLAVYCGGSLEKAADTVVATVEAVRWGLKYLKMISSTVDKLVIEGDNLQVIRWLNRGPDPPSRIARPLSQIFQLLECAKPVIHRVYEETNSVAVLLAKKGATLDNPSVWMCSKKNTVFRRNNFAA